MDSPVVATAAQCRAARALLNWTQSDLAKAATVARKTIADFELRRRTLHLRTRRDITEALRQAGVSFLGAAGVCLAATAEATEDAAADDHIHA